MKGLDDAGPSSEDLGSKEQLARHVREIEASLEVMEEERRGVEAALKLDNNNAFLLRKFDQLSKKELQMMEERKLWRGEIRPNPRYTFCMPCVI